MKQGIFFTYRLGGGASPQVKITFLKDIDKKCIQKMFCHSPVKTDMLTENLKNNLVQENVLAIILTQFSVFSSLKENWKTKFDITFTNITISICVSGH